MTNTATTKLIYQKQVFTTLKDCLCGCLNLRGKTKSLLKTVFVMCDFAPFSSTKPWHRASFASMAGHPPADSCSLTGVRFGQGSSKDCLQPFMGWYHPGYCCRPLFWHGKHPFKSHCWFTNMLFRSTQIKLLSSLSSCSYICTSKFIVPCSTPWPHDHMYNLCYSPKSVSISSCLLGTVSGPGDL